MVSNLRRATGRRGVQDVKRVFAVSDCATHVCNCVRFAERSVCVGAVQRRRKAQPQAALAVCEVCTAAAAFA